MLFFGIYIYISENSADIIILFCDTFVLCIEGNTFILYYPQASLNKENNDRS